MEILLGRDSASVVQYGTINVQYLVAAMMELYLGWCLVSAPEWMLVVTKEREPRTFNNRLGWACQIQKNKN